MESAVISVYSRVHIQCKDVHNCVILTTALKESLFFSFMKQVPLDKSPLFDTNILQRRRLSHAMQSYNVGTETGETHKSCKNASTSDLKKKNNPPPQHFCSSLTQNTANCMLLAQMRAITIKVFHIHVQSRLEIRVTRLRTFSTYEPSFCHFIYFFDLRAQTGAMIQAKISNPEA